MTDFYATKVHHKVKIPDDRVCSTKFENERMPSGISYAVRTGANNGVVNQRLSRFASKDEADSKQHCAGNQNWYNHTPGGDFHEPKPGRAFSINRPAFKSSDISPMYPSCDSITSIDERGGIGNNNITRPSFLAPEIAARKPYDVGSIDNERVGEITKVALDNTTLKQLFDVKVPDPTDITWLAEKRRLEAMYAARGLTADQIKRELEVNKPLGRDQRAETKSRNIGQSELSIGNKLNELKEEIDNGRAASIAQQATLMGQFALVLADTNAINALTQAQLTNLSADLLRLNVPRDHKAVGLPHRYIDKDEYKNNMGLINMYLISQAAHYPGLDAGAPIYNGNLQPDPITKLRPVYQLSQIPLALGLAGKARNYIDLQDKMLIKNATLLARVAANPAGWADPEFSGINPANR